MISLRTAVWAALLVTSLPVPALADGQIDYATARRERRLEAVRTNGPITVDGSLDEADWRAAAPATGFRQSDPKEGEPATQDTEIRVLYDDQYLYFGAFAHATPGEIIVQDLKKDFDSKATDTVGIMLDTYHDERNAYIFGVNAMGAKWDAQVANDGRDVNGNWDGIWFVKTRVTDEGWFAEIAIPFRTLRFSSADPQTWGLNFLRRIRHRNEDTYWAPLPRFYEMTRVSMAGTLEGLRGVRPGSDLRIKPYALTNGSSVGTGPLGGELQGGFDAKWGVTSSLTWDFTVNTDFSQVEADEQQVNLTRFSLFFPEKRDFFLENAGIFQFGPAAASPGTSTVPGRANNPAETSLFFSRRIGLSGSGNSIPILAGTRLTGRAAGFTVGAMSIQQKSESGVPATNFTALRLRRNVLRNSDVGVMLLNKEASGPGDNRFVGADANLRFFSNLNVYGFAAKTTPPSSAVGTEGRDTMVRAGMQYRGPTLETGASFMSIGDRFNDEMGFVPQIGVNRADLRLGLHLRSRAFRSWLRESYPHWVMLYEERTKTGRFDTRYQDFHLPFTFQNSAFIELGKNTNVEELTSSFVINASRKVTVAPGRYPYDEWIVLGYTDRSARVYFQGRYGSGEFYDGRKTNSIAGVNLRVTARLNGSLTWTRNDVSLKAGRYTTDLIAGRVNVSFSTRMFLNALVQYNTDVKQWTSNVRFNIIHRPLSDIFIVYNDRRDTVTQALIDRAIVAKVTYLLAF